MQRCFSNPANPLILQILIQTFPTISETETRQATGTRGTGPRATFPGSHSPLSPKPKLDTEPP